MYGLRETSGRFLISTALIVRPRSILPGSAIGASAVTETTSLTAPTPSVMFTTAVMPAVSSIPDCSKVLNPDSSAETL